MTNELKLRGNAQITPTGSLYIEKVSDTLHRVKKYKVDFYDGTSKAITHDQYEALVKRLEQSDTRFIRFKDGEVIAISQIKKIFPYEVIVDTRKENL